MALLKLFAILMGTAYNAVFPELVALAFAPIHLADGSALNPLIQPGFGIRM